MSLPDAVARLREGALLPSNAVAITFDDGYADNLAAASVLHRHGLTATFYITAGCLADGEPFWPAELRMLVDGISVPRITLVTGRERLDLACGDRAQRAAAVRHLTRLFKSRTIPERERLREQLRDLAGRPSLPRVMLTWNQLAEMHRLGMTVGAHTLTHPNLPSAGLDDATAEIEGSRTRLESGCSGPSDDVLVPERRS